METKETHLAQVKAEIEAKYQEKVTALRTEADAEYQNAVNRAEILHAELEPDKGPIIKD